MIRLHHMHLSLMIDRTKRHATVIIPTDEPKIRYRRYVAKLQINLKIVFELIG